MLEEGVHTITGDPGGQHPEDRSAEGRRFLVPDCLPRRAQYDPPVEAQVSRQQEKAPIGAQQMRRPGQPHVALCGQEVEYIPAHPDPAEHGAQHTQKNQQDESGLQDPEGRVLSSVQGLEPFAVQDVMGDEQHQHPRPQPLVDLLFREKIGHQQNQHHSHQQVHQVADGRAVSHRTPPLCLDQAA